MSCSYVSYQPVKALIVGENAARVESLTATRAAVIAASSKRWTRPLRHLPFAVDDYGRGHARHAVQLQPHPPRHDLWIGEHLGDVIDRPRRNAGRHQRGEELVAMPLEQGRGEGGGGRPTVPPPTRIGDEGGIFVQRCPPN